jgi:hypothetical protein
MSPHATRTVGTCHNRCEYAAIFNTVSLSRNLIHFPAMSPNSGVDDFSVTVWRETISISIRVVILTDISKKFHDSRFLNNMRQILHQRRKVFGSLHCSTSATAVLLVARMVRFSFFRATVAVFWLLGARSSMALPSGFVDEGFANINAPTGFSFAPKLSGEGYMMLVCEKGGRVWVLPNPDESDDEISSLDIRDKTCT